MKVVLSEGLESPTAMSHSLSKRHHPRFVDACGQNGTAKAKGIQMALQVLLATYKLSKEIGVVLPLSFNSKLSKRIKKKGDRERSDGEERKTPALGCPRDTEGCLFCRQVFPALGLLFSLLMPMNFHAQPILLDPSGNGPGHLQGLVWSQSHSAALAHSLAPSWACTALCCALSKDHSWDIDSKRSAALPLYSLSQPDPVLTCRFPSESLGFQTLQCLNSWFPRLLHPLTSV